MGTPLVRGTAGAASGGSPRAAGETAPAPTAGPLASGTTPMSTGTSPTPGDTTLLVPADSSVCSTDLPFKPPGCSCAPGETAECWTGPLDKRHMGDCKDGLQKCVIGTEFATWGQCEGQVLDCGTPPADPPDPPPPPPQEGCPCVPGAVVGCDEDCEALVICKPFSTKVCQPDGTFGPCRESLLPTADTNLLGCVNLFHGCFPENPDGVFTGDCSKAYTCGHPPNGSGLGVSL